MKSPILAPLVAAALLTLGLAGCGGSGSTNGESGAPADRGRGGPSRASARPSRSRGGELQDPHVAIDSEGGRVYVAWAANNSGAGEHGEGGDHHSDETPEYNAYLASSDDGGRTFSEPVRLNDVDGEVFSGYNTGPKVGAGWTPCIGPVLAGILTLAATTGSLAQGLALLATYSAGLAIPFMLATVALGRFLTTSRRFRKAMPWIERTSGALLVVLALLLLTGSLEALSGWTSRLGLPDLSL